jgi:hypothetical protein
VLGAFSAALTVLPWLHTLHHRDDHVHVDGAIVYLDDHEHAHEDEEEDTPYAGFDHPAHHAQHGRGALAHGSAFILAGAVFLLPPPAVALERLPPPPPPEQPAPAEQRSPRVTRGPPQPA